MFNYQNYLLFRNQIFMRNKAKIHIDEFLIDIVSDIKNRKWKLSTTIFSSGNKKLSYFVRECISNRTRLFWQKKGAYLNFDSKSNIIYLIQEVDSFENYLPFKHLINDFSQIASEWKEIFEESF